MTIEAPKSSEILIPAPKLVVVTDADGTILDHESYSHAPAKEALAACNRLGVPVVINSSKTASEIIDLQTRLGILGNPFIAENGGATYIPKGYFKEPLRDLMPDAQIKEEEEYEVIIYGRPYSETQKALKEAAEKAKVPILTIGDMSAEEFARETGLLVSQAILAKQRKFQEGFKILTDPQNQIEAKNKIREFLPEEFEMEAGGRFIAIRGRNSSKGIATRDLLALYKKLYPDLRSLGIGDAENDLPMLKECDKGILVKNPKKIASVSSENIHLEEGVGPVGWNNAVLSALG